MAANKPPVQKKLKLKKKAPKKLPENDDRSISDVSKLFYQMNTYLHCD